MKLSDLFFWNNKTPADNDWHPVPSGSSIAHIDNLPPWIKRTDIEAAVVDTAPFIAGAGGFAHMSQLNNLGWTAPANVFRNYRTMMAMHRTVLFLTPLILLCQAAGLEYRNVIPRWSHDRERRRDEEDVRRQVEAGMGIGGVSWLLRLYVLKIGRAYWAPIDVVMGGALADLMHREYYKAHGL
jgi:hypothetical protein